jgi:pyridoxal phosphate enzyme (YggS family)
MSITENLSHIQKRIARILGSCQRSSEEITLIAVTKTHPVELIDLALQSGILHIGENKVQEAMRKLPMLSSKNYHFHFIGHLQSNKINQLLSLKPALIHSIDSVDLAYKLHLALGRTNRTQDILIQINSSQEASKNGLDFADAEAAIAEIAAFSTLHIRGLMTIGKLDEPEVSRPLFRQMKALFDHLKTNPMQGTSMDYLSMGMSHDYAIALEEGANMLRIGSAIFGERNYGGTT